MTPLLRAMLVVSASFAVLSLAALSWMLFSSQSEAGDDGVKTEPRPAARAAAPEPPFRSCMNLGGALEAPREGEWGYVIQDRHLDRIAAAGFDAVRLPVRWSAHAETRPPHAISAALLARVDEVAHAALERGLTVIVNVHHYEELMADPDRHEPRLEAIWRQLAAHYQGWPEGLVFELVNEPHGRRWTSERLNALNARLTAMIRERHPDRWVIVGGGDWGNLSGLRGLVPPDDARVMTTFHFYTPFDFTHQGAPWANRPRTGVGWGTAEERAEVSGMLAQGADWGAHAGTPMFLGEFGVYRGVPVADRAAWTRHVREEADRLNIAWCYWDFATTLNAFDAGRDAWIPELRDALTGDSVQALLRR